MGSKILRNRCCHLRVLAILRGLPVAAAILATNMNIRGNDARMSKSPSENIFERRVPRQHGAIRAGKDEIRWRGGDGSSEIWDKLASDRYRVSVTALRRVVIV